MKSPKLLSTALNRYVVEATIGQGGAGIALRVRDEAGARFAAKVLPSNLANTERRKRFKNELTFCLRTRHPNIVRVTDFGVVNDDGAESPFYIMTLYDATLRDLNKKGSLKREQILPFFEQVLSGVEAAHLEGVTHRDLKPENIFFSASPATMVVGDFGIAHFREDQLHTLVQTGPDSRLANFQYAAPEQRTPGQTVDRRADIFALGLILNELFTGQVIQGTGYKTVGDVAPEFAFLDDIVAKMVRQDSAGRYQSISELKTDLEARAHVAVTRQKLDALTKTVVPESEIDDALYRDPPKILQVDYKPGTLHVTLDAGPNRDWIELFRRVPGQRYLGRGPETVTWHGLSASVAATENTAEQQLGFFKGWVAQANASYREAVEAQHRQRLARQAQEREAAIAAEAERLRVLGRLKL